MSSRKRLKIITLGCSKNTVDSEHLLAALPSDQFEVTSDEQAVDYLLLNTCGFILDAKEESISAILEAVELKRQGLVKTLIVFGCLSQRYHNDLRDEIPEVDAWFGARDLNEITNYLGIEAKTFNTRLIQDKKGYAYIKISEGCDRRCSYCAIPFIRGAHKSVPIEDVVAEARELAAQGVKELILIAQDTTYYGIDLYRKRALADLIAALSEIEEIEWIRIHYSYPADFPEDVLDQMANNPKVCRYLDIPLQHISDPVLKNMHRGVDGAWTRKLINKLREKVEGVVLRTTMIVGHPGEGQSEFEELLQFTKDAHFERLGAFAYSEEEGTYGAEHFEDSIDQDVKLQRLDILMAEQSEISMNYNSSRVGKCYKVMVDAVMGNDLICRSEFESPEVDGEIIVQGAAGSAVVGEFINARILEASEYDLIAERIL